MLTQINVYYTEHNPIGVRQWRYDECPISEYELENGTAKKMVQKAFAFMFKLVNDFPPCDCVHFIDELGTSLCCEVDSNDIWDGKKLVHVTVIDCHGNKGVPYTIDAASLRRKVYKMCEYKEVAA